MEERPKDRISRDELYGMMWEKPAIAVAKDLSVSCSILTRVCRKLRVPKPPLGYWAKVAHGQKPRKPPLPALKPREKSDWKINRANSEGQRAAVLRSKLPPLLETAPETKQWLEEELKEHPWVRKTRMSLKGVRPTHEGRCQPKFDLPHLSIDTTKPEQERALSFMNRLIHLCEREGILVGPDKTPPKPRNSWERSDPPPTTQIRFHWKEQSIGIRLKEKIRRTTKQNSNWYDRYEYQATGLLECLLVGGEGYSERREWKDGKCQRIEEFIPAIMASIKDAAEQQVEYFIRRAIAEERQKQMDSMMSALNGQQYREKYALDLAFKDAEAHAKAETLRRYAEAAESRFKASGKEIHPYSKIGLWLEWLRVSADAIDPLTTRNAPWWDFVDKVLILAD